VLLDHLGGDQRLHHADDLLVVDLQLVGQRARVGELAGLAHAGEEELLQVHPLVVASLNVVGSGSAVIRGATLVLLQQSLGV
jgi:hypothetical protein